jgi:hypothetical protein
MNTKKNIRKLIAIIFSLFMGNGLLILLSRLIPDQMNAILPKNANIRSFVVELIGSIISIGLIILFHKTNVLKISVKGMKEGLICGLPIIVIYGLLLALGLSKIPGKTLIPVTEIIFVTFNWILIGIAEEGLFRGVILGLFIDIFGKDTRKGVFLSIICTGILFGLNHFQNLLAGVALPFVLIQVLSAMASGLMFGAIAFRSEGSIWPMVMIHALIDASGFIYCGQLWGVSEVGSVNSLDPKSLIMIPIFTGIFIFLMRKDKTDHVIESAKIADSL